MEEIKMVSYEEFKELIREVAEEKTGQRVAINQVKKNNGIVLDGLVIIDPNYNLNPTIYLNDYYHVYKEYMDTEENAVELVWEEIYRQYKNHLPEKNFDVCNFTDFEKASGKLRCRLINYEKNQELLEELAYVKYLDLAVVFYVIVDMEFDGLANITVRKEHLELWGRSEEELFELAKRNMADDYEITSLASFINQLREGNEHNLDFAEDLPMYIVSNHSKQYGAAAILCDGVLRKIARDNAIDRIAIIPSSVHETIVLEISKDTEIEGLNSMVQLINESELSQDEVLSDHVYVYDLESDLIRIA